MKFLLDEEPVIMGGSNHNHSTKDLTDDIAYGNYPEWKLYIQTMNLAYEDKFDFLCSILVNRKQTSISLSRCLHKGQTLIYIKMVNG
jgi:hypothetical protein